MKKLAFFLFLLVSTFCLGADKNEIDKIIKSSNFKEKNLGIVIANENKILFELNSEKLMTPASLTKIFTGATILKNIPLNLKFRTEVLSNGKISNEILEGDLCVKGGGDPSFVSEKMWYLVNEIKRNGLKKISGDLILDSTKFDSEKFDSGRDSVRVDRAYDAPVSALAFNWNSVNVFVRSGDKIGEPARVIIDPENSYIEFENKTKTVKEGTNRSIDVNRVTVGNHDKIIVSGNFPLNDPEFVAYKSITNPPLWFGINFVEFLKQRNIVLGGKVKEGNCSEGSRLLAFSESKNLFEITTDMLKFSNNFVTEMLVKNMASLNNPNIPAKMQDGLNLVKKYIESLGIKSNEYEIENVAGLTRANKFTPKQLLKALLNIKNDLSISPEFISGLPIAGVDGTIKSRMKDNSGTIRAKTGYLDGIVGLAGYIGREDKNPLTFVCLYNGGYEEALASRKLCDNIVERVKKWE